MPEHMVMELTGRLPEPILIMPCETWDTFELHGCENEFVVCGFMAAWKDNKKLLDIGKEAECKTRKYKTMLLLRGTGIVIPRSMTQQYGIRMDHYLEVIMKKVVKGDNSTEVFPEREVFEYYPVGFDNLPMK